MDNPDEAEAYRTCIIMGMAGLFSGVVRLPLCATLVSVEMVAYASLGDRNTALCFPILLCCMSSYVTAVYFSPDTLFEILLKQDGISEHEILSAKPQLSNVLCPGYNNTDYDSDAMSIIHLSSGESISSMPESISSSMKGLALLNPALARQHHHAEEASTPSSQKRSEKDAAAEVERCPSYDFIPAGHDGASDMTSESSRKDAADENWIQGKDGRYGTPHANSPKKSRKGEQQLAIVKCKSVGSRPGAAHQPMSLHPKKHKRSPSKQRLQVSAACSNSSAFTSKHVRLASPNVKQKKLATENAMSNDDQVSHDSNTDDAQEVMGKSKTWQPGQRPPPLQTKKSLPVAAHCSDDSNPSSGGSTPRSRDRVPARAMRRRDRRCHSGDGYRSKGFSPPRGRTRCTSLPTRSRGGLAPENVTVDDVLDQLLSMECRLPRMVSDIAEADHEIPWDKKATDVSLKDNESSKSEII
jgi:hypothetical protein